MPAKPPTFRPSALELTRRGVKPMPASPRVKPSVIGPPTGMERPMPAQDAPGKLMEMIAAAGDPMNALTGVGGPSQAATIPMAKLMKALEGGLGWDLVSSSKSPILQNLYNPSKIGSSEVARTLSGMRPMGIGLAQKNLPGIGGFGVASPSKAEARLASQEIYRISQKALNELGIGPEEVVDLWRGGVLPQQPHILTPTHIDKDFAFGWRSPTHQYSVPRQDIRALVGLFRRGDETTAGEALVPSVKLAESMIEPPKWNIMRGHPLEKEITQRIPSWYKRSVLK